MKDRGHSDMCIRIVTCYKITAQLIIIVPLGVRVFEVNLVTSATQVNSVRKETI